MQRIKNSEFGYLGNPAVKRDGVETQFSKDEVTEYIKCMRDPAYFAITYLKVISLDSGLVPFKLYPYQENMFKHFDDNRFSIILACRQSGKSISSVGYLLWYACFHPEKTIAVLANKGATAREMLARITLMLENLPFFLQPGTKALNKGSIEFSNNSKIVAAATSGSSIRGLSINLLFLDEFAFIENDAQFYTSTYPVVSSGKDTKIIITSTANGIGNVYHKIWEGATQGTNEFKPFRVDWWDVPGRDEEWKRQTIANTSALQFEQEFGNTFHGRGNTLIDASTLLAQKAVDPMYFKENINIYSQPEFGNEYVMCVDVSKGRNQDYSTFNIIDVSQQPFQQVCTFRDNTLSPMLFPDIIVESSVKANALGATMTKRVKRIGCSTIKDLIEQKKLIIHDAETIVEMSTFVSRGTSYQASGGNHDDLMMNLVLFGWFTSTDVFENLTDINIKGLLYKERLAEIQDDMLPFGFISNPVSDEEIATDVPEDGNVWFDSQWKRG